MALVSIAFLFTFEEQVLLEEDLPLLSVCYVTELLEYYQPKKTRNEEEILEIIGDVSSS